ncbi:MAG: thiamine pyrophosphate-dependent enzyme, partial [Actinomycetota bacterium]
PSILELTLGHGALADKLQGRTGTVTACFFGEGAVAEGEFHEAMNLAALWDLPVLFCCENNLYAMGTSLVSSESETDLALKASSYQLPAWSADGMDVDAVAKAATDALIAIRSGAGPVFLECRTYRFRPHSMFDPDLYRSPEEIAEWKKRDPITMKTDRLLQSGEATPEQIDELWAEARAEIEAAVDDAEAAPLEAVEDLARHVYAPAADGNGWVGHDG